MVIVQAAWGRCVLMSLLPLAGQIVFILYHSDMKTLYLVYIWSWCADIADYATDGVDAVESKCWWG